MSESVSQRGPQAWLNADAWASRARSARCQQGDVHTGTCTRPPLHPAPGSWGWGVAPLWGLGCRRPVSSSQRFPDSLCSSTRRRRLRTRTQRRENALRSRVVWAAGAHLDLRQVGLRAHGGHGLLSRGGSGAFQKRPCDLGIKDLDGEKVAGSHRVTLG